jgi:transcription elongation GreA/GreB family factor/23S rRNA pseudoU1915 N3-methylase RlmH
MDATTKPSTEEDAFQALLKGDPLDTAKALDMIHAQAEDFKRGAWTSQLIQKLADAPDFAGLYKVVKDRIAALPQSLTPDRIHDLFKKACHERNAKAFLAAAEFGGSTPLAESFRRFDLLASLKPGTQVIDKAWGFGVVKRVDDFYSKAIVDFKGNPSHALSFATVCETTSPAPKDHLFTVWHNDPARIAKMQTEEQGELVKLTLASLGNMPVTRLETTLDKLGLVPAANWKKFWEAARRQLKSDPLVEIPVRRAENIQLRAEAESYGDTWFAALAKNRDTLDILKKIEELEGTERIKNLTDAERATMEERLNFAIKGAQGTDAPLYSRLSAAVARLGFKTPPLDQLRAHLWDGKRYLKAAADLSVRDTKSLAEFLLAGGGDAKEKLLADIPEMPYNIMNDVLQALKETPEAEAACAALLNQPKAPATLICWIFHFRDTLNWPKLPPLIELLGHAIMLVEGSSAGETLRMQNYINELFEEPKWLEGIFKELDEPHRQLFFERIQASPAWDPSTHRSLLGRMLLLDPKLAEHRRATENKSQEAVRWTSWRSMKEHQAIYKKLVEVELPKNSHDIAVARGYGDLRENFEYQSAKDLQRQLLQRQQELQQELKAVKGTDFSSFPTAKVGSGVTVTLSMPDGTTPVYTILGEWDRDEKLSIISNKTRLAAAMEGKTVGEKVSVPSASGDITATIASIAPLSDAVKAWIAAEPAQA